MKAFRKILLGANVLLVLLTFGAYLAPVVSPTTSALLPILGLGYPPLLLCHFFSITLWLLLKSKWVLLSGLTLVLGYNSCTRLLNLSIPDCPTKASLKVASYNLNFAKPIALLPSDQISTAEQAYEAFLSSQAVLDVMCVQEDGQRTSQHIKNAMAFNHVHRVEGMSVAIYSIHPIVNKGIVDLQSTTANTCLWADILFDNDTIRLYTTHLEANRHNGEVPEVIEEDTPEDMSNSVLWGIIKHHAIFSSQRLEQARSIKQHQATSPYPTIICGDFNETPQSYVYTVMKGDMSDTFEEEGMGIASTFGEKLPALRIDHMFVTRDIEILNHDIHRSTFSDHYMIVGHLELKE